MTEQNKNINKLFEEYEDFIKMQVCIARRTIHFSHEDFEDCLQEANIAFLRAINTYKENDNCSFKSYAAKVINNQITDYVRKMCRLNSHTADDDCEYVLEEKTYDKDEYLKTEYIEAINAICKKSKSQMTQNGATAIKYMLDGYEYEQIANIMNLSKSSVKVAVHHFRQKYGAALL